MQAYYPLNYEINYYGTVYNLNATELAWLEALLRELMKRYTKLDSSNTDLQSLVLKGLVTEDGTLTRAGIFLASYAFMVHPKIKENPLYSITYNYILNPDTLGINMKTKYESVEPKYNFQKTIKKFMDKKESFTGSFKINPVQPMQDIMEAMPVTPNIKPFEDVVEVKDSSVMTGYAYNYDTEELDIHMKGGAIYRYQGVPSIVFNGFHTVKTRPDAEYDVKKKDGTDFQKTLGGYFSKMIRNNYKCIRIA